MGIHENIYTDRGRTGLASVVSPIKLDAVDLNLKKMGYEKILAEISKEKLKTLRQWVKHNF
jgi:hypothetical protein